MRSKQSRDEKMAESGGGLSANWDAAQEEEGNTTPFPDKGALACIFVGGTCLHFRRGHLTALTPAATTGSGSSVGFQRFLLHYVVGNVSSGSSQLHLDSTGSYGMGSRDFRRSIKKKSAGLANQTLYCS